MTTLQRPAAIDRFLRLLSERGVPFTDDGSSIRVAPRDESGFEVRLDIPTSEECEYTVYFHDGGHQHFDDAEEATRYAALGLSTDCRLRVVARGGSDCIWTLQQRHGESWVDRGTMGLLLQPFWRRAHVRYLSNCWLRPKAEQP
jgi:hypothetical protein